MHFGNSGRIGTQILWNSRNQEYDEYDQHPLLTVDLIQHFCDFPLTKQNMHCVFTEKLRDVEDDHGSYECAYNGQRKSKPEPVEVSGSDLQRLSRNDAHDDLGALRTNINKRTLSLVLPQPVFNVSEIGEILDQFVVEEINVQRYCHDDQQ